MGILGRSWKMVIKGTIRPRTGHEGPEGEYRCNSTFL
jgi:hypothetical protein